MPRTSIHLYTTGRCNLSCNYCFRPDSEYHGQPEQLEAVADMLVKNGMRRVTIGGGEPTLVKNLESVLSILKSGGIYTALHTNGTRLTPARIKRLSGLVDMLALPIDSTDEATQQELRCKGFLPVLRRLPNLAAAVQDAGIALEYHTVFTTLNVQSLPKIHDFVNGTGFDLWRLYEVNDALAMSELRESQERTTLEHQIDHISKLRHISYLRGPNAFTKYDWLITQAHEMEKVLGTDEDRRIQFVYVQSSPPYLFLDWSGEMLMYHWLTCMERPVLGNVLSEGFDTVMKRAQKICDGLEGKGQDKATKPL